MDLNSLLVVLLMSLLAISRGIAQLTSSSSHVRDWYWTIPNNLKVRSGIIVFEKDFN